jgi:transposase, IS605 orfB family
MLEAVMVALDPTPAQERLLLSHAGAARFAYNAGLAHVRAAIEAKEKPEWSLYGLRRWWNANKDTLAVNADGTPWWRENSKEAYSSGLESLANALSNWSKSRKGERKGRRVGFPTFKAKDRQRPRFAYTTGSFGLIEGDLKALRLPRIGRVHCMENVTGRVRGAKVARIHARIASRRRDLLDKLTTWLAGTYSDISIEDLNVAGMVRNHRLAKAVNDASFAELRRQLEYKTARTGARLHVVDRWYPSSKMCSRCGRVKAKLSLTERTYRCEHCGVTMDRDLNAAINIKVAGSAPETLNAHRGTARRNDLSGRATLDPVKCEPSRGDNRVRLGADGRKTVLQATTN